jgi:hypothetical protein
MNEILQNYEIFDDGEPSVAEKQVFDYRKVKRLCYAQVVETLRTSPFLALEILGRRMNILPDGEHRANMNLMRLLEYFDTEYEPIIRKRMIRVGYSRAKILEVLRIASRTKSTCLAEVYSQWLENESFNEMWNTIEPIIGEISYLLDFYGITFDEFNGNHIRSLDDELIEVEIGDDVQLKDRILKFEKFNV